VKDFIITFIVAFVLFKVLSSIMDMRKQPNKGNNGNTTQRHVGDITIEETQEDKNKTNQTGYTDYEEIK